ncbi:putative C-S lyase [Clostridiaceae bacterium DONG20-135]|uniref:cysteine-S-conjugate beta-lyase n=1 Tax=Copranaerobaculum intestinale TaxID=2692629 RepID=A0A6N8U581_9FIRM|nr:MalY/PatB family protein [Copranaerobaculum intestinale]MXQ73232.1 putative C-S lyase [Copranaerobaculum intestinale]
MKNLDEIIERRGTTAVKWNHLAEAFGCDEDALPLWVADMDFACADPILAALKERITHPVFGYEDGYDEAYTEAVTGWFKRQFDWELRREDLFFSPGVVPALGFLIDMLSEEGEGIIIQSPVYYPFAAKIRANHREVIDNPLICENGCYRMDFDDLAEKMRLSQVRGMILCNPHNPVGRVWSKAELKQVAAIAEANHKWIISDEIHCDLIRSGYQHTPLAKAYPKYREEIITCTAPSKTFNLAGLQNSNIIIHKEAYRKLWKKKVIDRFSISECNTFSRTATIAAYKDGEAWLREVNAYVDANFQYLSSFLKEHLPKAVLTPCEGTYLAWIDFRAYVSDAAELERIMRHEAKVILDEGSLFGENGNGYERINLACPQCILKDCLNRIAGALIRD